MDKDLESEDITLSDEEEISVQGEEEQSEDTNSTSADTLIDNNKQTSGRNTKLA